MQSMFMNRLLSACSPGVKSASLILIMVIKSLSCTFFVLPSTDVASPFKPLTEERRPDVLVVPPLEVKSCTQGKQAGLR